MARVNVIHQSLMGKKMFLGVDEKVFWSVAMFTFAFVFAFKYVLMLPVGALFILLLRWFYKGDQYMLDVYQAYRKEADMYDPWPRVDSENKRPDGYGRDMLC